MRQLGVPVVCGSVGVRTNQFRSTHFYSLGTFGGIAHYEDRLPQTGGFFLHASGVSEHKGGSVHHRDEGQVTERLD